MADHISNYYYDFIMHTLKLQALTFLYPLIPNGIICIKQLCIIYTNITEGDIFHIVLPTVVCVFQLLVSFSM